MSNFAKAQKSFLYQMKMLQGQGFLKQFSKLEAVLRSNLLCGPAIYNMFISNKLRITITYNKLQLNYKTKQRKNCFVLLLRTDYGQTWIKSKTFKIIHISHYHFTV